MSNPDSMQLSWPTPHPNANHPGQFALDQYAGKGWTVTFGLPPVSAAVKTEAETRPSVTTAKRPLYRIPEVRLNGNPVPLLG